jgi:hypothetical protein
MKKKTAEQVIEQSKGLTFEIVWAAMMESDARIEEYRRETERQIQETQKQMKESQERMEKSHERMEKSHERMEKSHEKTERLVAELSKNIGGVGNSLGLLTETLFSAELWKKFRTLGYEFTRQAPRYRFTEGDKISTEVDYWLENGEYAMPVEVKTVLETKDVDWHLARIEKIRKHLDKRNDKRKLVGAVAGGVVDEDVLKYAQDNGLYVVVQSGDSMAIADMPQGFKAREW